MEMTIISRNWTLRSTIVAAYTLSVAGALGMTGSAVAQDNAPVRMTVEPSAVPAFVASDRGFFGDLDVEVSQVGYSQVQALLVAGDTDVAWISPIETAEFIAQGSDFKYFSTAGAQNMYNGVVIQADKAEAYGSIGDLKGKRLGIPGYGTGTWTTFQAFVRAYYGIDDAKVAFDVVTASSGALLALVERGEIDAALLFSGSSAAARSLPQFQTIFSFTDAMQENTGQPLVVNGAVATTAWLEENKDAAATIVVGLDEATRWIGENPEAFSQGGEYAALAEAAGWLSEAETTSTVQDLIREGKWYLTSEAFTSEWKSAVHGLLERGGTIENLPAVEEIFLTLDTEQ